MSKEISRRNFAKIVGAGTLSLIFPNYLFSQKNQKKIIAKEFSKLPSPEYNNIFHNEIQWNGISKGLDFSRIEVYRGKELVDIIATLKINPEYNKINVFNGYSKEHVLTANIEEWQKLTNATAMINSTHYQGGENYYKPCALVLGNLISFDSKGKADFNLKKMGPLINESVRGMLVSEAEVNSLPKADLLDFKYDKFDYKTTPYKHGVQHWPILLDREENIRVNPSSWQANRTVVSKTNNNEILFMTTEGGYFTLYNFGQFLRDSNLRSDKGFNVNTAMNMDGGYEANMIIKCPNLEYLTYGEFETYGPKEDKTIFNQKTNIPGVIGIFPRD